MVICKRLTDYLLFSEINLRRLKILLMEYAKNGFTRSGNIGRKKFIIRNGGLQRYKLR